MPEDSAEHIRQLIERGELNTALRLGQQALVPLKGEARGQMLLLLSWAHLSAGQALPALRAAVTAGEVFKACGSREGTCDALVRVGNTLRSAGDQASAVTTLEQAEELARELGDPARIAVVLRNIGVCCSIIGRHQHALSCLHEALELLSERGELGDRLNGRLSFYNALNRQAVELPAGSAEALAALHPLLGSWQALADDCAATGHTRLEMMARGNHAITLNQCGDVEAAVAELQPLLRRYRELGMRPNEAICHNELGRCYAVLHQPERAREQYRLAIELLRDGGGALDDLLQAHEGLSLAEEALGNATAALAALREVRAIERRKSDDAARSAAAQRELRIELARLTSQWAQQATEDPLTGLGNRRALERWLDEYLPRVEHGERLTLLLMDLDHFKQVNDRFGHGVGDQVLKHVAGVIRRHCRGHDLAVRYGGEEFLLALAGAPLGEAVVIGQRVRESIQALAWEQLHAGLAVTVSIGATEATEAANAAALLTLADKRLYAAKYNGRNRLVAA